jgi:uncharacterized surface protein with fasciclin (FAS1) repeats
LTRTKKQLALATVVAILAVGGVAYFAVRTTEEPSAEKTSPLVRSTPTPSPLNPTPVGSPTPSIANEDQPVEGGFASPTQGSASPTGPTPNPVSTHSLCPFLPSGSDPGSAQDLADETADVAVDAIPVLSVFAAAIHASGFDAVLRKAPGVTILAPTDDAFASDIPEDELEELLIQRHDDLKRLLESHTIGKRRPLGALVDAGRATTLSGAGVTLSAEGEVVRISNDANVVCSDLKAANARVHVIDSVLGYIQLTEPQEELG